MGASTTAQPNPQFAKGKIHVVIDNQQILCRVHLIPMAQFGDSQAAPVHIGHWLDQHNPLPANVPLANLGIGSLLLDGQAVTLGQVRHAIKPDIVPCPGVLFAWIAQPYDYPHRFVSLSSMVQ